MSLLSNVLADLCALYLIIRIPRGMIVYEKWRHRIAENPSDRSLYFVRLLLVNGLILLVIGLIAYTGSLSLASFGIIGPKNALLNQLLVGYFCILIVLNTIISLFRLQRWKKKNRKSPLQERIVTILPHTNTERSVWLLVSLSVGISEEIIFRGFLTWYIHGLFHFAFWLSLIFSSLLFGLAHLYQGWKNAIFVTNLGGIMAAAYFLTGSLIASIILHILWNLRLLVLAPAIISLQEEPIGYQTISSANIKQAASISRNGQPD